MKFKSLPFSLCMPLALMASTAARADGFRCETPEGTLRVRIHNQVRAEEGTRNGAVMVLSDALVGQGRRTIARFEQADGLLSNTGSRYTGTVDLRFNDTGRKGERILGTRLGELRFVDVVVDFSYAEPVSAGEQVAGEIHLTKRNGAVISAPLRCSRYLKH